jgi:alpha-beta hydrolase superfamily lysophospholipase
MKTIYATLVGLISLFFSSCDLESMMYHETPLSSYSLRTDVIPEAKREFVTMTSQGRKIYGYFIKSDGTNPTITILYFHGNWDHLQYYWPRAELLYKAGCNVFIFDYQGYGMSDGSPSEQSLYADCRAALDYVLSRNDVSRSRLVFFGYSLGCAGAIDLASYTFSPSALCLEAPYASSSALLQSGTLLNIPNSYVMRGEYNNAEKIKKVQSPVLVIHGEADNFIDLEKNGAVVFNNANSPKLLIRVPGADHEGIPATWGPDNYVSAIRQFILTYTPAP